MIGFTFDATIYDGNGADRVATVLLRLDVDGADVGEPPTLDARLQDGDGAEFIVTAVVEDVYDALWELHSQRDKWIRENAAT